MSDPTHTDSARRTSRDRLRQRSGWTTDLADAVDQRRRLAQLEWDFNSRLVARCGRWLGFACGLLLAGATLLLFCLAQWLSQWTGWSLRTWVLCEGLVLVIPGSLAAWIAVRQLRQRFTGMALTCEELQEDLVWFREWAGGRSGSSDDAGNERTSC